MPAYEPLGKKLEIGSMTKGKAVKLGDHELEVSNRILLQGTVKAKDGDPLPNAAILIYEVTPAADAGDPTSEFKGMIFANASGDYQASLAVLSDNKYYSIQAIAEPIAESGEDTEPVADVK
jgi:hypothetical protein